MEIVITPACAQRHAARAHPVSPVWPLDHHYHVDAGLFLCRVVCRGSLPPRSQFPEAAALVETPRARCSRRPRRHAGNTVCGPPTGEGAPVMQTETETTNHSAVAGHPRSCTREGYSTATGARRPSGLA